MIKAYAIHDLKTGRIYNFLADREEAERILLKNQIARGQCEIITQEFESIASMDRYNAMTHKARWLAARKTKKSEAITKRVIYYPSDEDETPTEDLGED